MTLKLTVMRSTGFGLASTECSSHDGKISSVPRVVADAQEAQEAQDARDAALDACHELAKLGAQMQLVP